MKMHDPKMLHAIIQALAKVPSKHFEGSAGEEAPKMPAPHDDMIEKPEQTDGMSEEASPLFETEEHEKHDNSMKKLHAMKGR